MLEEFKVAKCRVVMMYRDSGDLKIRGAGPTTKLECGCTAETSVAQAESLLKLKDIIGHPFVGDPDPR